ncbi:FAD:protein FMN transferase [Paenibacillus sp. 1P07SE]|uniref:FAD:protein FMN transferase n=1 Tax=Paenibacillus sp. 1P07SE TaxID=3132209 RepID=UPI0039A6AB9F
MMKKQLRKILVFIFLMSLFTAACSQGSPPKSDGGPAARNYFLFSTIITVRVYDEGMTDKHFDRIRELLEIVDQQMNRQLAGSEIDQVNAQAGGGAVEVSEDTYAVVEQALRFARLSDGAFDPTVGPLVDLWAIGNGGASVPPPDQIEAALALVGHERVELEREKKTIRLNKRGMGLDLGAIAKGYAADLIAEYLTTEGFESALIDLGGNILAFGAKPGGESWSIGIQDPAEQRGDHLGTLQAIDKTIVTSGVYERFFKTGGQVYHHILDPVGGYPFQNDLLSVTIVSDVSMVADALSTTVFGLGLDRGMAFVEQWEDAEAIFVTTDHEVYVTAGLQGRFQLSHSGYRMPAGES